MPLCIVKLFFEKRYSTNSTTRSETRFWKIFFEKEIRNRTLCMVKLIGEIFLENEIRNIALRMVKLFYGKYS
jgi:hypothetical protein